MGMRSTPAGRPRRPSRSRHRSTRAAPPTATAAIRIHAAVLVVARRVRLRASYSVRSKSPASRSAAARRDERTDGEQRDETVCGSPISRACGSAPSISAQRRRCLPRARARGRTQRAPMARAGSATGPIPREELVGLSKQVVPVPSWNMYRSTQIARVHHVVHVAPARARTPDPPRPAPGRERDLRCSPCSPRLPYATAVSSAGSPSSSESSSAARKSSMPSGSPRSMRRDSRASTAGRTTFSTPISRASSIAFSRPRRAPAPTRPPRASTAAMRAVRRSRAPGSGYASSSATAFSAHLPGTDRLAVPPERTAELRDRKSGSTILAGGAQNRNRLLVCGLSSRQPPLRLQCVAELRRARARAPRRRRPRASARRYAPSAAGMSRLIARSPARTEKRTSRSSSSVRVAGLPGRATKLERLRVVVREDLRVIRDAPSGVALDPLGRAHVLLCPRARAESAGTRRRGRATCQKENSSSPSIDETRAGRTNSRRTSSRSPASTSSRVAIAHRGERPRPEHLPERRMRPAAALLSSGRERVEPRGDERLHGLRNGAAGRRRRARRACATNCSA